MAIHSSILAWKTPWTEEPGGLRSMGSQKLDMTSQSHVKPQPHMEMGAQLGVQVIRAMVTK